MVREIDIKRANPWRKVTTPVRPQRPSDGAQGVSRAQQTQRSIQDKKGAPGALYAVTDRSKKNAGDFLIHKRAVELICREKEVAPSRLTRMVGWRPLNPAAVNQHRALIICGGPALAYNFYPSIYPLCKEVSSIRVPIFLLGVGAPALVEHPQRLSFNDKTLGILRYITTNGGGISTRDPVTTDLLERYGVPATTTGCPVYFHPSASRDFRAPRERPRVLFTPGMLTRSSGLTQHHNALLRKLKHTFGDITIGYHRGRGGQLDEQGLPLIDVTGGADKMERYSKFDIHIGYRVHAHIWFASTGRPSFLIPTDVRGMGANRLLDLHLRSLWTQHDPDQIVQIVQDEAACDWTTYRAVPDKLARLQNTMSEFVARIPNGA